jgi:hypothetical protein
MPIQHITALQDRWLNAEPAVSFPMKNALETIVSGTFADPQSIGYEFLQNADDACATEIEYAIVDRYLIIRHNGEHFLPRDMEALCSVGGALPDQDLLEGIRQTDMNKIGYKGIGFKSVFRISDEVRVLADLGYSFKFSKAHWPNPNLPWQIMPIHDPVDDLPAEIQDLAKVDWINYVIKLRDDVLIGTYAAGAGTLAFETNKLVKKEQIILFLRNVSRISLFPLNSHAKDRHVEITRKIDNEIRHISRQQGNSPETSRWLVKDFTIPITETVKDTLVTLNDNQCPKKLREAASVQLSFAAKFGQRDEFVAQAGTLVFSYLPTEKTFNNLPFFINSSFLLNPARTEFLPSNAWNQNLMKCVGYYQLKWFEELANDNRFKLSVTDLIASYADTTTDFYNKAINEGLKEAQSKVAFVAVTHSNELQKATDVALDSVKLAESMPYEKNMVLEQTQKQFIADPNLKNIKRLLNLGAADFNREAFSTALRTTNRFNAPAKNHELISFIYKSAVQDTDWYKTLHETNFILSREQNLRQPKELYLPLDTPELGFELEMQFMHDEVHQLCSKEVKTWLQNGLHLAAPSKVAIVERAILPLIADGITQQNTIPILRFIFSCFCDLLPKTITALRGMKVLCTTNRGIDFKPIQGLYLSNTFEPAMNLQDATDELDFISDAYYEEGDDISEWRVFLKKLGAREDLEVELFAGPFNLNDHAVAERISAYWTWLQAGILPDHNEGAIRRLHNYVFPKGIRAVYNNFSLAGQYWESLLSDSKFYSLRVDCSSTKFQHSQGHSKIPSNFEFIIKSNPCFPCQDETCRKTTEVYSFSLSKLLDCETRNQCSSLELSLEKEAFIGIKSTLTLEECLEQLKNATSEQQYNLFEYIIQKRYLEEALTGIPEVLSQRGEHKPANELHFLNLPQFAKVAASEYFVDMQLETDDAIKISTAFGIKIIGIEDLVVVTNGERKSSAFKDQLDRTLPFFAAYVANIGASSEGLLSKFQESLASLTFYEAAKIELTFGDIYQTTVDAWLAQNTLYHTSESAKSLYAAIELVAKCLDCADNVRELEMLYRSEHTDACDWLKQKGIEPPEIVEKTKTYEEDDGTSGSMVNESELNAQKKGGKRSNGDSSTIKVDPHVSQEGQETIAEETRRLAKTYLEDQGFAIPDPMVHKNGILQNVKKGENTYSIIVVTARTGLLRLNTYYWQKLAFDNFKLLVRISDNGFQLFHDQAEVLSLKNNPHRIIVRLAGEQDQEVLDILTQGIEFDQHAQIYFNLGNRTSNLFDTIKGFENSDEAKANTSISDDQDI